MKDPAPSSTSLWTTTNPAAATSTGEVATPIPMVPTLPKSSDQRRSPSSVKAWRPCVPNQATTRSPSLAGVGFA